MPDSEPTAPAITMLKAMPLISFLLITAACTPPALSHTEPSADALARGVLEALERRDESRLRSLALSEGEFERRVWPGLPAARAERNMPWSYVWMELRQKSDAVLQRTLAEHGGRHYTLESVYFDGPSTQHPTYRVHRDAVLAVRDDRGMPHRLKIVGSLLQTSDGWKVFSYVVD